MSEVNKSATDTTLDKGTYEHVENFFLKNRNNILIALGVIVLAIGGYFAYKQLYMSPRVATAQNNIAGAQNYFAKDSFDLALNGDGAVMGFLAIAENYGNTPSGNMAHYYAGVCYMRKAELDNAIKHLEDFNPTTNEIAGEKYVLLGHAYADKKDYKKAIDMYKKAGDEAENNLQSPAFYKFAGDLMSEQNDLKGALEMYRKIKQLYPLSQEGQNIDLDITYAENKLGIKE
ncbi:MAG TPA: tetratricopeptide repeat protein [Chitinophagales bacterium]|nr:tetratricopeptide repeat protein [Chitinophagales bacterium]HMU69080.1 tetratricopeptide repeat protein [Chitinophagales bacterium]HMZ89509.1 tetratricopeptide repeat protein [Chitinophagales bacterium]HNA56893.1 tetratricopeptide repeat protein [Chitinophagales bacterium]HNO28342.1 tetratricopeptide repeat protein [Chitinophagales bacterium]